jgi:hypothetical protein
LRSLQFLPESIVRFMRRGVRSAVASRASRPRTPPRGCAPRAPGERRVLTGDLVAPTEVDLVRCLAFERGMRDPLVVFSHVELDEPLHRRDVVERVEEQPPMFERAPPCVLARKASKPRRARRSRRPPDVPMVQAADPRQRDHLPQTERIRERGFEPPPTVSKRLRALRGGTDRPFSRGFRYGGVLERPARYA